MAGSRLDATINAKRSVSIRNAKPNHTSEVVRQAFWVKLLTADSGGFGKLEFEFMSER
jgi:hypothetical protein